MLEQDIRSIFLFEFGDTDTVTSPGFLMRVYLVPEIEYLISHMGVKCYTAKPHPQSISGHFDFSLQDCIICSGYTCSLG